MRLTKTAIQNLAAPATGYSLYYDDALKGFGLRITASGIASFIAEGRVGGRKRRITLGRFGVVTAEQPESALRKRSIVVAATSSDSQYILVPPSRHVFGGVLSLALRPANPSLRWILSNLSFYMDPQGKHCFPSMDTQHHETGLSISHAETSTEGGSTARVAHPMEIAWAAALQILPPHSRST